MKALQRWFRIIKSKLKAIDVKRFLLSQDSIGSNYIISWKAVFVELTLTSRVLRDRFVNCLSQFIYVSKTQYVFMELTLHISFYIRQIIILEKHNCLHNFLQLFGWLNSVFVRTTNLQLRAIGLFCNPGGNCNLMLDICIHLYRLGKI